MHRPLWGVWVVAIAIALAACSPALNWREARLNRLTALLPCKPDKAQREVRLGARTFTLALQGCEAQGALFAISHVSLQSGDQASAVVADWRNATLDNMQSVKAAAQPFQVKGVATHGAAVQIVTQGRDPRGVPVHARLAWFVSGTDVFHLAVYGPEMPATMTELLFSELRLL